MPLGLRSWFTIVIGYLLAEVLCFHVELRAARYVAEGGSLTLKCDYSVLPEQLHKVEWFRSGHKIFQYVKGRRPPFRNYSIPGAALDWNHSNEKQVVLKDLDIDASGLYSCEVSTETPIYTKPSEDLEVVVVQGQMEDPLVSFGKPVYTVGEWLQVNCTSGPARPTPDVTWLVNGKQADAGSIRKFPVQERRGATAELGLAVSEKHVGLLRLTCLTTIPGYMGHRARHNQYADHRAYTVTVEVLPSIPVPEVRISNCSGCVPRLAASLSFFSFLILLQISLLCEYNAN